MGSERHDGPGTDGATPRGARSMVPFASDEAGHAIEVAPRIWWVGRVLENDLFQSHSYLIEAGSSSVLIDPGSTLTIDETLRKIAEVIDPGDIANIVVHHSDPDVADALHRLADLPQRPDRRIITEWRSGLLLRHYVPPFPMASVEDLGWTLPIDDGRNLEFALTPYLHFPGAFVSYERSSATLFSADIFGGFNRAARLWAAGPDDFEDLRSFHEHYMPSREILMAGLATIRRHFRPIRTVCPQHGYVLPEDLVDPMFEQLGRLECGVLLMSRSDEHLARLVQVAGVARRLGQVIDHGVSIPSTLAVARAELAKLLPVGAVALELVAPASDDPSATTVLRFEIDGEEGGRNARGPTSPSELEVIETLGRLRDGRAVQVVITLLEPVDETQEVTELLLSAGGAAIDLVERTIDRVALEQDREALKVDSRRDPLTNLANRRVLDALMELSDAAVAAGGSNPPAVAIMVDLDHFKMINDRFGHPAGDEVLRRVASVLTAAVRRGDEVIRYGGEEMLVLARLESHDPAEAVALAERLRARIAAIPTEDVTPGHPIWASMGVAVIEPDERADHAIERADQALYQAKQNGRDRVELAPPAARATPTIVAPPLDELPAPDTAGPDGYLA